MSMRRYGTILFEYWLAFGRAIGVVMTPVQLLLVYGLVFGPAKAVITIARKDVLDRRLGHADSHWRKKEEVGHTLEETRHQF